MQDFSRESYRLIPQYLPHYAKMMEDKDNDTRALMAEAFSVAVQVLARFDGIEPHEVVASVYVFCKDEKYKFISRYFESCVESAALTPDAFAKGLHKWCNALAAKIKNTEGGLKAFAEFASLYRRLQTQKAEAMNIDERVVNAYIDLICLLLSYVRPQKLDSTKALCGVTTDGKGMTIHDHTHSACCRHGKSRALQTASADTRTFIRTASTLARSTGNTGSTMSRHRKMCRH